MTPTHKIKVFIFDDIPAFIDGLRLHFQLSDCIEYIGHAVTPQECLERTKHKSIDIILIDIVIRSDRLGGIKVAKQLQERYQSQKDAPLLVFLTGYDTGEYLNISKDLDCSFLNKHLRISEIIQRLKQIYLKKKPIRERVKLTEADLLQKQLRQTLTPSEGRVAVNLAVLDSNRDITIKLIELGNKKQTPPLKIKKIDETLIDKKVKTVQTHLRNIYNKLDLNGQINNRQLLIQKINKSGLVDYIEDINKNPKKWFNTDKSSQFR